MLNAILTIARARFLVARNTLWRGKIGRKISWVILFVALCFGAWGINWAMKAAVSGLRSASFREFLQQVARATPGFTPPASIDAYLFALPSAALFAALLLLVLTSFSTVLSSLYLSGDIDMLLVAPVPMRAVFVVKFFSGMLIPYLLLFVFVAPALVGYGRGMGFGPAYYLSTLTILALLPLLPLSLGALLVMAVVRVIPARRAREIVGVISGLIGVLWYVLSQFSRQIGNSVSETQLLGALERLNDPLLPSAWAGRALVAAGLGDWGVFLLFGGLFAVVSVGAFLGALILGERVYYEGWSNMATQGGRSRRRATGDRRLTEQSNPSSVVGRVSSLLPRESAAILFKDLRVFPRDLRNVQQLIFPLVMAGIWMFNLLARGSDQSGFEHFGPAASALRLLVPAGISAFICLTLSVALGGPNISREGRGFWQLKLAPISPMHLLIGKFALAYLPYPIVGTLLIGLISILQRSRPLDALAAWAIVVVSGLGVCAISCGLGAAFPKFNWETPSNQQSFRAGCLSPIFYMTYMALAVAAMVGMPLLGTLFPSWSLVFTLLGWALALGLTALVVWGFMTFGARRLGQVEV